MFVFYPNLNHSEVNLNLSVPPFLRLRATFQLILVHGGAARVGVVGAWQLIINVPGEDKQWKQD